MAEMVASVKAAKDESLAAIAEIQAALDALHGSNIDIGVSAAQTAAAAAATDRLAHSAAEAAGAEQAQAAATGDAAEAAARDTIAQGAAATATEDAAKASVNATEANTAAAAASSAAADEAMKQAAADTAAAAAAEKLAGAQARIAMGLPGQEPIGAILGDEPELWKADITTLDALTQAKYSDAAASVILAAAEAELARSDATAKSALQGIADAMSGAGGAVTRFGISWNAIHWILAGGFETLAVVIPAAIALGAGLDVASQGATNMYNHVVALWTATESMGGAFNTTMGKVFGLKTVLQNAQDAANPGVYELLGSVINDCKEQFGDLAGAGLDVVHVFDELAARITVDLRGSLGTETQGLLSKMVPDLVEIGQVFGNLGHAILNFASDMPGLAEVLLKIVDALSGVILWLSTLPHWLIEGAMAMEEFYRWGGLAASIIARIGMLLPGLAAAPVGIVAGLFSRLAGIMGAIVGTGAQFVSGFAKVAQVVGRVVPAANEASTGLYKMAGAMSEAAQDTALMGTIGAVVAGTIILVAVLSRVKDATDAWVASTDKAVQAASDLQIYNVLGKTMEENAVRTDYATQALDRMGVSWHQAGEQVGVAAARFGSYNGEIQRSAQDVSDLTQQQTFLSQTARTVGANVNYLANTYHISTSAAQAMAQEAGVNLQHALTGSGQAAAIARQQIANFVTSLGAMSAPAGVVGNDMEAIGIQSQLAGTKVQQLNQAWDAWMSSVTGSMADFSQVQTAIAGMATDAAAKSASLSGSIGSISRAAGGMSYTLKGMGADAMQSWQQLTSALDQGNSALDQLRTGMAEGVITGGQFKSTVQGLVGEMIPFVAGNRTATEMLSNLAHEAGGPVTTSVKQLADWTGVKGKAAADQFSKGMNNASIAMGNMSKVATNLSAVVSSDLDAALAQSITTTSGVATAVQKYAQDLANAHTPASTLHQDLQNIAAAEARENKMTAEASQGMNKAGTEAERMAAKMHTAAYYADALASAIRNIPTQWTTDITVVSGNVGHALTAAGAAAGHASGTPNAAPGLAIVGEQGPELMMMHGGEAIFNATETARMLSGIPSAIFGATGGSRASSGGGGSAAGAGAAGGVMEAHLTVMLDGQQIHSAMQSAEYKWQTRNSGVRSGLSVPGRRVG